jgi:hypothetical protein
MNAMLLNPSTHGTYLRLVFSGVEQDLEVGLLKNSFGVLGGEANLTATVEDHLLNKLKIERKEQFGGRNVVLCNAPEQLGLGETSCLKSFG